MLPDVSELAYGACARIIVVVRSGNVRKERHTLRSTVKDSCVRIKWLNGAVVVQDGCANHPP